MKKTNILFWIFNGLFCFVMLGSAIPDILSSHEAVKGMHGGLGYPLYFVPFIGVAKALGVFAVLLPLSARLKEWAYAGLSFDLIGASFSLFAVGINAWFMIIPISVAAAAYYFFRKRQALSAANKAMQVSILHESTWQQSAAHALAS